MAGDMAELVKRVPFRTIGHLNTGNNHHAIYRNDALGITWETYTRYRHDVPGEVRYTFFLEKPGSAEFGTLQELFSANPDVWGKAVELYPETKKTFDDIVSTVAQQTGLAKKNVDLTIDVFLDVIADAGMAEILKGRKKVLNGYSGGDV